MQRNNYGLKRAVVPAGNNQTGISRAAVLLLEMCSDENK